MLKEKSRYENNHPNMRINLLIVDDEKDVLNSLKRLFNKQPYHVITATSGAQAIDFLRYYTVDVIISDMHMPTMSGPELLAKVNTIDEDIPCIVLSAYAEAQNMLDIINNSNIHSYISKPWDNDELITKVKSAALDYYLKRVTENYLKENFDTSINQINQINQNEQSFFFRNQYSINNIILAMLVGCSLGGIVAAFMGVYTFQ